MERVLNLKPDCKSWCITILQNTTFMGSALVTKCISIQGSNLIGWVRVYWVGA